MPKAMLAGERAGRDRRRHRAVLPHAGNRIGAIEFHTQRLGCVSRHWNEHMIGKIIVGLAAVAIVSVATTMSASAQQKKITVAIPKQVCEMLNVDTQNWGRQTVQLCGPPGGARGQATIKQMRPTAKPLGAPR